MAPRRFGILGALVVFVACAPGERRIREVEVARWQDGAWETTTKATVLYDTFDRCASITVIDQIDDIPVEREDYEYLGVARNPERVSRSVYRRDDWAPVEDLLASVDKNDRIFHLTRRTNERGRWVELRHEDVTRRADGSPVWREIYSTTDAEAPRERIRHFYRDDGLPEARSVETIVEGETVEASQDDFEYDDLGRRLRDVTSVRMDGEWAPAEMIERSFGEETTTLTRSLLDDGTWRTVSVEEIDETDPGERITIRYDIADGERTPVCREIERYENGYEQPSDLSSTITISK